MFRGLSLFAGAGIAEMNLSKCGINIVLANELLPIRCKVHEFWNPKAQIISGDITDQEIKDKVIYEAQKLKVDFMLITPPCQGVSLIGKNKTNDEMVADERNYLLFHALEIINVLKPKIVIIENVARFLSMKFPYKGNMFDIEYILNDKYKNEFHINKGIYNSADYGIPQNRLRAIFVLYKDGYQYKRPKKQKRITVRQAIGDLPSLEAGEVSTLKNHYARKHLESHILWMQHTPTGKSAVDNALYFPQKSDGSKLQCYSASYKRIDWDKPAPTITMRNDAISSQSNVHPGRLKEDGTYSDARVLTLRELFILSSINPDINVPKFVTDIQVRQMIGEAVPPKLLEVICKNIKKDNK